jgi:hypothetical protein
LIFLLRIFTVLFRLTPFGSPPESITSGNYDTPPRSWWWFKLCVLVIFLVAPWISRVGDWALRWTEGNEALQVIFVMLVFPVIMNATQYYIIDSFIKKQTDEHELIPDGDDDETHEGSPRESIDGLHSDEEEDDPEVRAKGKGSLSRVDSERGGGGSGNQTPPKTADTEYDPQIDGENSPTVLGSANTVDTDRTSKSSSGY